MSERKEILLATSSSTAVQLQLCNFTSRLSYSMMLIEREAALSSLTRLKSVLDLARRFGELRQPAQC